MQDDEAEEDREYPLWSRILLAATMLAGGAAIGGAIGESWGSALAGALFASPFALLGFCAPGVLGVLLGLLELFSCGF